MERLITGSGQLELDLFDDGEMKHWREENGMLRVCSSSDCKRKMKS